MDREKTIQHLKNIGVFDTNYSIKSMESCINQVFDNFENKKFEYIKYTGQSIEELEKFMKYKKDFVLMPSSHCSNLYIFNNYKTERASLNNYIVKKNNDFFIVDEIIFENFFK